MYTCAGSDLQALLQHRYHNVSIAMAVQVGEVPGDLYSYGVLSVTSTHNPFLKAQSIELCYILLNTLCCYKYHIQLQQQPHVGGSISPDPGLAEVWALHWTSVSCESTKTSSLRTDFLPSCLRVFTECHKQHEECGCAALHRVCSNRTRCRREWTASRCRSGMYVRSPMPYCSSAGNGPMQQHGIRCMY